MITKDREYRSFEFRANQDEMVLEGTPIVFNTPTVMYEFDGIKYYETIDSRALDGADISDVILNVDHEGKPAAKTKNNTLILEKRAEALGMKADVSKNATGRELFEDVTNGFFDKMSFAFTVEQDSYNRATRTRTIEKIRKLYDVSCVSFPAYSQTSLSARSFFEAEAKKEMTEVIARDRKIQIIKIKTQIARLQNDT